MLLLETSLTRKEMVYKEESVSFRYLYNAM
jgi:hypothetical protein